MANLPETVEAGEPFTEAEVTGLERMVGTSLVADYRETVLQFGAVFPADDESVVDVDWRRFDGGALSDEDREEFETTYLFYGLWPEKNIRDTYERIHLNDGKTPPYLPKHYVPIAHDTGGSVYLLDSSPQGGAIWLWGMNLHDHWGTETNIHIGFVAESFTDFITNRLKSVPEDW